MAFVVVYDANVLYPSTLRAVLVHVALTPLVQAKWTERTLDEAFRSLRSNRPDLAEERLDRTRRLLSRAVPDWMVTGYEPLIDAVDLAADPDDRYVVAAAIRARAQLIVTFNTKHFPAAVLAVPAHRLAPRVPRGPVTMPTNQTPAAARSPPPQPIPASNTRRVGIVPGSA